MQLNFVIFNFYEIDFRHKMNGNNAQLKYIDEI